MTTRYFSFLSLLAGLWLLAGNPAAQAQRRWRVNNNAGVSADFATVQAAHDAAVAGDIIYVEGSGTGYPSATLTKRLTIIGTGYFLDENPGLTAPTIEANVSSLQLNAGSAGTLITGLYVGGIDIAGMGNITIRRNRVSRISLSTSAPVGDPIVILQNYLDYISSSGAFSNVFISNNYLSNFLSLSGTTVAVVNNNVIGTSVNVTNSTLSNNILTSVGAFTQVGSSFSNNLGAGTQFGTANGNQNNVVMANVFLGPTGNSPDGQWRLRTGSPAIGAGTSGVDCGMFGGSTPYVLAGIANVPTITAFTTTATGNNATPLNVTISTRSNR